LIAEAGSVPYVFNGIKREDFPSIKPTLRYGQVPSLTVNSELTIYQTPTISRFLAQESNSLYPKDHIQATLSEEYVATIDELLGKAYKAMFASEESKREEETKAFLEGPFKQVIGALDGIVEKNGGYLVDGQLSWADLWLDEFARFSKADFTPFPNVFKLIHAVENNEKVKDYLNSDRNLRNRK